MKVADIRDAEAPYGTAPVLTTHPSSLSLLRLHFHYYVFTGISGFTNSRFAPSTVLQPTVALACVLALRDGPQCSRLGDPRAISLRLHHTYMPCIMGTCVLLYVSLPDLDWIEHVIREISQTDDPAPQPLHLTL